VIDATIVGMASLFTSAALLDGPGDVLQRRKLARRLALRGLTAPELLDEHAKRVVVVSPTPLRAQTLVEPSDAAVLDCAVTGHAQAIVSGDETCCACNSTRVSRS